MVLEEDVCDLYVVNRMSISLHIRGLHTWGLVIYRCAYENGNDWGKCLTRLRQQVKYSLDRDNGLNIMERLQYKAFERIQWRQRYVCLRMFQKLDYYSAVRTAIQVNFSARDSTYDDDMSTLLSSALGITLK